MRRQEAGLFSPAIGGEGAVIAYGHYGRPMLVFPSEQGSRRDYEDRGMIASIAHLIDAGRVKVYCVDSFDASSWSRNDLPLEERARRHTAYEDWILNQVVPWIHDDSRGAGDIMVTGCSFGAYHAANLTLKRADLFPLAICHSGVYDVAGTGWGERGDTVYFNNPMDYIANAEAAHLTWLRERASLLLICGQGQWEDTTGALASTTRFAELLVSKGIRCELDLWGHDVPHDWPSWRNQIAHHLPRFC
ncbi:MAG: esterase family protein [Actinomycetota bacterium]